MTKFPLLALTLTLAHIAHEANRAYCRSIGDGSQPAWDDAPEWQRDSAVKGIEGALAGNTPEQQHQSWCDVKVADGWVYGQVKDPEKKEHPCLVPYADLPDEQKRKDHLYSAVVRAAQGALTANLTPKPAVPATPSGPPKHPFEYQKPTPEHVEQIETVRAALKAAHNTILAALPPSRERSIAVTKLEEVSMWANKGIVFN